MALQLTRMSVITGQPLLQDPPPLPLQPPRRTNLPIPPKKSTAPRPLMSLPTQPSSITTNDRFSRVMGTYVAVTGEDHPLAQEQGQLLLQPELRQHPLDLDINNNVLNICCEKHIISFDINDGKKNGLEF